MKLYRVTYLINNEKQETVLIFGEEKDFIKLLISDVPNGDEYTIIHFEEYNKPLVICNYGFNYDV